MRTNDGSISVVAALSQHASAVAHPKVLSHGSNCGPSSPMPARDTCQVSLHPNIVLAARSNAGDDGIQIPMRISGCRTGDQQCGSCAAAKKFTGRPQMPEYTGGNVDHYVDGDRK